MTATTIHLAPASDYRAKQYGVLMESTTLHLPAERRGWHNPGYDHRVEVWENRPGLGPDADPDVLVTPDGKPTEERYSYLLAPQATVITAWPEDRDPQGEPLSIGQVVELMVHGYSLGQFEIRSRQLHNPYLVKVA